MRTLLYIIILAAMLFAPVRRLDIAKLEPVEAVAIYKEDGFVQLHTDTGAIGRGDDAEEALQDLRRNALNVVYLDTADYLLVGAGAEEEAEKLKCCLRRSVQIDQYLGGDVKEEARYLEVHGNQERPGG